MMHTERGFGLSWRRPFVMLAILAGCSAHATDGTNTQMIGASQREAALAQARASCDRALSEFDFSAIRPKLVIRHGEPTFDMLANKATATDEERRAIAALADRYISCSRRFIEFQRQYLTPMHASLSQMAEDTRLRFLARLYSREITYADYNQAHVNLLHEYRAARARLDEALARERAAQAQYLLNQANQSAPPKPGMSFGYGVLTSLCESQGGTYDPTGGCRQPQPINCSTWSMDAGGRVWNTTCR